MTSKGEFAPESIRVFVQQFKNIRPAIFEYFSDGQTPVMEFSKKSEEGAKLLLLYSSLNQDISEKNLTELILGLRDTFRDRFFNLTTISFENLDKEVRRLVGNSNWSLLSRAPGILRSTCDFFKIHPSYLQWLKGSDSTEELVEEISQRIFFMGKTSIQKFKARTYIQMLMISNPETLGTQWKESGILPVTRGARNLLHFLFSLKKQKKPFSDSMEEMAYYNSWIRELFPNDSYKVQLPFNSFKINQGPGVYVCETRLEGCENCILQKDCRV